MSPNLQFCISGTVGCSICRIVVTVLMPGASAKRRTGAVDPRRRRTGGARAQRLAARGPRGRRRSRGARCRGAIGVLPASLGDRVVAARRPAGLRLQFPAVGAAVSPRTISRSTRSIIRIRLGSFARPSASSNCSSTAGVSVRLPTAAEPASRHRARLDRRSRGGPRARDHADVRPRDERRRPHAAPPTRGWPRRARTWRVPNAAATPAWRPTPTSSPSSCTSPISSSGPSRRRATRRRRAPNSTG